MGRGPRSTKAGDVRRVRRLRREMGVSERVLWDSLRDARLGFKFRRQYPTERYFLDFFCPEARLCVEVDGEVHALRTERDAERDAWLAERGILTLRIPSLDLFEETGCVSERWIGEIARLCEQRSGRAAFPG